MNDRTIQQSYDHEPLVHACFDLFAAVLREHWLARLECDEDRSLDRASCACSRIALHWQPSVGEAVQEWIEHIQQVLLFGDDPNSPHALPAEAIAQRLVLAEDIVDNALERSERFRDLAFRFVPSCTHGRMRYRLYGPGYDPDDYSLTCADCGAKLPASLPWPHD